MFSFIDDEKIIYAAIIIACLAVVYVTAYHDFNYEGSVGEMYFLNYPDIISQNQSVDFSLLILNHDNTNKNYIITVFLDNIRQRSTDVFLSPSSQLTLTDSISSDNLEVGGHRIKVELYDKNLLFTTHGSKAIPYYIFFNVDVI